MSSPVAANTVDAAVLADELVRHRVVDANRLTDLLAEFPGGSATALAEFLVWRGVLSPFQAERALAGSARWLTLGPYRLTCEANPGTFGPVYAATHRDKPGEFRLRMFPLRSLWRARQAKQLARSLAATPHPVIVPLTDADSANGFHYLVWPHAEGETLSERVAASGPRAPGEVAEMLAHLADALYACHDRQVAHGTITPQCIVLSADGLPRLLEHGAGAILSENLAADESLLDTLSATVATATVLEYAAPEFITCPGAPTPIADQYALGAVAYFALTGHPPFANASRNEQLIAKLAGRPQPLAEENQSVPPDLASVIERMLSPTPGDRFSGLDKVRDRLRGVSRPPERVASAVTIPVPPSFSDDGPTSAPTLTAPVVASPDTTSPDAISPDAISPTDVSPTAAPLGVELPGAEPWPKASTEIGAELTQLAFPSAGGQIVFALPKSTLDTPSTTNTPAPARPTPPPLPPSQDMDTPSRTAFDTRRVATWPNPDSPSSITPTTPATPSSPPRSSSPAQTEDSAMAKLVVPDPFNKANTPRPSKMSDPRSTVGAPVQYHTEVPTDTSSAPRPGLPPVPELGEPPVTDSVLWKRLKQSLMFWRAPTDVVQASVFGPPSLTPGQSAKVSVYLHPPETADSVHTLCRAFHHDAVLIGAGYVSREIAREENVGVHISVANAGVTKSMLTFTWRGQPHRLVFDLHVPWESPAGLAPGMVSIGIETVRIGKIEFQLNLLPRKG